MNNLPKVKIIEKSWIARIAAWNLKSSNVAITFGRRIMLHNATKEQLVKDTKWLRHELKHIEQYKRYGFWKFIFLYLKYSWQYGYYQNPLEIEARLAELDDKIIDKYEIIA